MPYINQIEIMGHVGKDPVVRAVGDQKVANFSVATSESWKDKKSGEWMKATEWHQCVAWRWAAERAEKFVRKGSLVLIKGALKTRKWKDKDGVEHETKEIVIDELLCLDKRNEGSPDSAPDSAGSQAGPAGAEAGGPGSDDDGDLPF